MFWFYDYDYDFSFHIPDYPAKTTQKLSFLNPLSMLSSSIFFHDQRYNVTFILPRY